MTPIRIAVIGAGRMGLLYARLVREHPLSELAALVCASEATSGRLRDSWEVPVVAGGDLDRLASEAPDIGAVVVATPEGEHEDAVCWAAGRRIAVLLEKPMADSLEAAARLAEAAAANPRAFTLCHVVRFDPRYAAMRDCVRAGRIGRVRQMYARRNADQAAAARILGKCHPAFWLAPHDIDIMRWTTGAEVTEVDARYIGDGSACSDGLFVDLVFSDGSLGRIENAWATPPLNGVRNCVFDVLGDGGAVEVDASQQGIAVRLPDDRTDVPNTVEHCEVNGRLTGAFANMIDAFVRMAALGEAPAVAIEDGLATMRVADAIARSLETGGRIRL